MTTPFRRGQWVKVVGQTDAEIYRHECKNKVGIVREIMREAGIGDSYPDDPVIRVEFPGKKKEVFWKEELELIPARRGKGK